MAAHERIKERIRSVQLHPLNDTPLAQQCKDEGRTEGDNCNKSYNHFSVSNLITNMTIAGLRSKARQKRVRRPREPTAIPSQKRLSLSPKIRSKS
jgi:hypothetical protein